jgi:hemerythrin-like domain-containing protein
MGLPPSESAPICSRGAKNVTLGRAPRSRFIRRALAADKCHHGKEELILFPALLATKAADAKATVDELLKEHEVGRAAVRQMSDGIAGWEKPEARRLFAAAAHDYVDLLRRHIAKETEGLLPLSERLLSRP